MVVVSWCLTLCNPRTVAHQTPLPRGFPGENTGVGYHFLLQGIFLTQGSNPGLFSPALAGRFLATREALIYKRQRKMLQFTHTHTHTHSLSLSCILSRYGLSQALNISPRCRAGPCCLSLLSMGYGMPSARRDGRPLLQTQHHLCPQVGRGQRSWMRLAR